MNIDIQGAYIYIYIYIYYVTIMLLCYLYYVIAYVTRINCPVAVHLGLSF